MPCRLLYIWGNAAGHFTGSAARAAPGFTNGREKPSEGFSKGPPDTLPVQRRGRGPRDSRMAGRNPARVSRKGRRTLYRFSGVDAAPGFTNGREKPSGVSRKGRRTLYRFSGVDAAPGIHEWQGETQRGVSRKGRRTLYRFSGEGAALRAGNVTICASSSTMDMGISGRSPFTVSIKRLLSAPGAPLTICTALVFRACTAAVRGRIIVEIDRHLSAELA